MANRSFVTFHVTLIAALFAAGPIEGAEGRTTGDVLQRFEQSIQHYMTVHRAVEHQLPAFAVTADARAIDLAITMRAAGIRLARATARQGDIFAADIARVFRAQITKALESHDYLVADLLLPPDEDGETPPPALVNGTFAWRTAIATPACVLATLPSLPEELQYRFVGRDLVLVDIEANLIVDVLPDALPGRGAVDIPVNAIALEGTPQVRIDLTPDGATRRELDASQAAKQRLTIKIVNGRLYRAGTDNHPLVVTSSPEFTYLSSTEPGRYVRLRRLNDRITYVEHVDMPFGSVTYWGEVRIEYIK